MELIYYVNFLYIEDLKKKYTHHETNKQHFNKELHKNKSRAA